MDQVGQQGDAAGGDVDRRLDRSRRCQNSQRNADDPETLARALDAGVDEAVGVLVAVAVSAVLSVLVRAAVRVPVDEPAMAVQVAGDSPVYGPRHRFERTQELIRHSVRVIGAARKPRFAR